jgi:cytochrome c oxidase assembly factor CtaG
MRALSLPGWSFEPWSSVLLAISAVVYYVGSRRLIVASGLGRRERRRQAAIFWIGWIVVALTLTSPLHELGEHLFFAHMTEHELLMVTAAPLLVAARPIPALLLGFPPRWRAALMRWARTPAARHVWSASTELWTATALHVAVLWVWHLPLLFTAALDNGVLHILQHLSFFLSALLFWEACWRRHVRGTGQGEASLALFLASLQAGLLGALLTFSGRLWYPGDAGWAAELGLTPLQDQQLAGLIMWIPACSVYIAAGLWIAGCWLSGLEGSTRGRSCGARTSGKA